MDLLAAAAPIVSVAIQLLAAVLLAVGSWAVAWLGRRLRLQSDDVVRGYLNDALMRAVDYAETQLRLQAGQALTRPEQWRQAADLAAHYARQSVPDALKRLGVGPGQLDRMILARLPLDLVDQPKAGAPPADASGGP